MQSATTVILAWERPAFNGKFVTYHIEGGPTGATTTQETLTVNNLVADKYYMFSVYVETDFGNSAATTVGPVFGAVSKSGNV